MGSAIMIPKNTAIYICEIKASNVREQVTLLQHLLCSVDVFSISTSMAVSILLIFLHLIHENNFFILSMSA